MKSISIVQVWDGEVKPVRPVLRYLESADDDGSCKAWSIDGQFLVAYSHHEMVGFINVEE